MNSSDLEQKNPGSQGPTVLRRFGLDLALVVFALLSSAAAVISSDWVGSAEVLGREKHLFHALRLEEVTEITLEAAGSGITLQRHMPGPATLAGHSRASRAVKHLAAAEAHKDDNDDEDRDEEDGDEGSAGGDRLENGAPSDAVNREPNDEWAIVGPVAAKAEVAQVDELLRAVQFATFVRQVPKEDIDRAAFGLQTSPTQLSLRTGKQVRVVRVGGVAPTPREARYVEVSGAAQDENGVFVVSANTAAGLSPEPDVLRVRQLVPYAGSELSELQFQRAETTLSIEQRGQGQYFYKGRLPGARLAGARLARDVVDRLLLGLARSQLDPLLAIEVAQAALVADSTVVELVPRLTTQPRARIRLGGVCPEHPDRIVALREQPNPSAGCIPSWTLKELLENPEIGLDRGLFHLRFDEVESLRLDAGKGQLELVRDGDTFRMRAPVEALLEKDVVQARLDALLALRGDWQATPKELPLGPAAYSVELRSVAANEADVVVERIEVWLQPDGQLLALRKADGAWLRLMPSALRTLAVDALLVRERELVKLKDEEVRLISVTWSGGRQVLAQPQRGRFELKEPTPYKADAALAVALVDGVAGLHAESWVAERDNGSFGLDKPKVSLELVDPKGNVRAFSVGAKADLGRYYAKERANESVFTIKATLVDVMTSWLVDRSGFGFDPDQVESVKLTGSHGGLEFRRVGGEYVQTVGGVAVNPQRLLSIVEALSLVRPDVALALDARDARYGLAKPTLEVVVKLTSGELIQWAAGVGDVYRDNAIYYARILGQNVVYAVPRGALERVFEAL